MIHVKNSIFASWSLVINASAPGQVEQCHFLILVVSSFFPIKVKCCYVFVSLFRGMHHGISNLLICKNKMLFWSTRRNNTSSQGFTSVCFFFFFFFFFLLGFFASCVGSSHLPSCSITLENLLYKVPRKALLCCLVQQCGLYNSASGGIHSICPECLSPLWSPSIE